MPAHGSDQPVPVIFAKDDARDFLGHVGASAHRVAQECRFQNRLGLPGDPVSVPLLPARVRQELPRQPVDGIRPVGQLLHHAVRGQELGVGEVIGEIALSDPHHIRTVNVIAKEPTLVLEWNVNHIKGKIPVLWKKLLKLAWKNIRNYYEE